MENGVALVSTFEQLYEKVSHMQNEVDDIRKQKQKRVQKLEKMKEKVKYLKEEQKQLDLQIEAAEKRAKAIEEAAKQLVSQLDSCLASKASGEQTADKIRSTIADSELSDKTKSSSYKRKGDEINRSDASKKAKEVISLIEVEDTSKKKTNKLSSSKKVTSAKSKSTSSSSQEKKGPKTSSKTEKSTQKSTMKGKSSSSATAGGDGEDGSKYIKGYVEIGGVQVPFYETKWVLPIEDEPTSAASSSSAAATPPDSRYLGVSYNAIRKKWLAHSDDKKRSLIGEFSSEIEAARAYDQHVLESKGRDTPRNFEYGGRPKRYLGVQFLKKAEMWRTRITHNGVTTMYGPFHNEIQAAKAYDKAAIMFRGSKARLNFPNPS